MKNSSWTGRAPRTLEAAFGPYTSHRFVETSRRVSRLDWWLGVALAVAVGIAAVAVPMYF